MNKAEIIVDCIKKVIGQDNKGIFVHEPSFEQSNALSYLEDCINTGWVSSAGEWVSRFEDLIAEYTGAKYVIAVNNGTAALRLALFIMGVREKESDNSTVKFCRNCKYNLSSRSFDTFCRYRAIYSRNMPYCT